MESSNAQGPPRLAQALAKVVMVTVTVMVVVMVTVTVTVMMVEMTVLAGAVEVGTVIITIAANMYGAPALRQALCKKLTHLTRCIFRATKEVRFLHYYYHPIYR